MLLITEYIEHQDLDIVCEQDDNGKAKAFRIKGPFLQAEVKNRNGRIYEKNLLMREVECFNKEKIKEKRSFGELDHPPSPTVNLERVSHLIESLSMEGNNGIGVAKILDTPKGRIAHTLLEAGTKLGVSTRGVGSLNGPKVNDDFKLITVDIVADPSAPDAFVDGILENKEFIINNNRIVEKAVDTLENNVKKNGSREIAAAFSDFLDNIKVGWAGRRK